MMDNKRIVRVRNNSKHGSVGYTIPDLNNLHRNFSPNEEKEVTVEELKKLTYIQGGEYILKECLSIEEQDVAEYLLGHVEPEYFYTAKDVERVLESGSLNEFLDLLDFAPDNILNLVKTLAVETELNDMKKREAILEKLDFNVTKAIENSKVDDIDNKNESQPFRRLDEPQKTVEASSGERRITPPKYNVINKSE